MMKKAEFISMAKPAKLARQGKQMIIVNPHDIIGFKQLVQLGSKMPVDPHVAAEIAAVKFCKV